MTKFLGIILYLVIPGLLILGYHLKLLKGQGNKAIYMATHIYTGRVYAGIPGALAILVFAMAAIPQSEDMRLIIMYIAGGFGVLSLIFNFIRPSFLKPAWLKWMEREHGDIMPLLKAEAREMGDQVWNERTQTQADLEDWVAEVRQKYGR